MSNAEQERSPHRDLWRALSGGGDRNLADREARSNLRKLGIVHSNEGEEVDLVAAVQVPAFSVYCRRLRIARPEAGSDGLRLRYAAVAASVIAWIDEDTPNESVGRTLGPADKDQSPRLAEMRFMRLLRCDTPERLLLEARRMSRILGGRANVDDLGTTLAGWESSHGLRRRRTWAFDYWAKRSDAFAPVSATSNS